MNDNKNCTFNFDLHHALSRHMLKHKIIEISHYINLINFLKEESIVLDEATLNSIEEEFTNKVNNTVEEFGSVFVKLNYSAATDANFLVHEAKCFNLIDVLTLLKGSTKLNDNFSLYLENTTEENEGSNNSNKLYLIIKPWYKIDNRDEFRLFICNTELNGICQRYLNFYFDYSEYEIEEIKDVIGKFVSGIQTLLNEDSNMVIDVIYLRKCKKIKIVDVTSEDALNSLNKLSENISEPYSPYSYFLLFSSWQLLANGNTDEIQFKFIKTFQETFNTAENMNKFPLEIQGEDKGTNVAQIIELLKESKDH